MAIFGIGAYYDEDVSEQFIENSIAGPGWSQEKAPELFQYMSSLKVGDIVYIKSCPASSKDIHVKGIGFVADHKLLTESEDTKDLVSAGRRINWINTENSLFQSHRKRTMFAPTQCMKNFILRFRK